MDKEVCTPKVVTSWGAGGGTEGVFWPGGQKDLYYEGKNVLTQKRLEVNIIIFKILGSSNMGVILFFVEYFLKF